MIIEPKVREYICTTAHPQGCAESVRNQADYACKQGMVNGTKKALIIGCSTGYGLASRICALENCGADTLGIMFERQANGRRTATPGWYNTAEFHRLAAEKGAYAKTVNGDAFSKEIKDKIDDTEERLRQLKNQEKKILKQDIVKKRKERTHRLITRRPILESL